MSWIEKLYKTYENNINSIGKSRVPLLPIFHTTQIAQVTIVIDGEGNFLRGYVLQKEDARTIIPATEKSFIRTSGVVAHPLCDKLQYVAADYVKFGGDKKPGFDKYLVGLENWKKSDPNNSKLNAIYAYVKKGRVVQDLVEYGILYCNEDSGKVLNQWKAQAKAPDIFKLLAGGIASNGVNKAWQMDAFVRFSVEELNTPQANVWSDVGMWDSWIRYFSSQGNVKGFCFVLGSETFLADKHPAKIRNDGDQAKLISSNDGSGFTFRGRFTSPKEVCGVSFEVSQKAHSALRWLFARQGRKDRDLAVVAWAVSGADVPDLVSDTFSLLYASHDEAEKSNMEYTAQEIGIALTKLANGYKTALGSIDNVVVIGLDSATTGRLAIRFYRELTGSEFLNRILEWHDLEKGCTWHQKFSIDRRFVGAPSPRDIAECAYGNRVDEQLRKTTVERLLPCIVDGIQMPRDLVELCVRRAVNRQGLKSLEWEKALGVACSLFKYYYKERKYLMTLERDRKTRDYLYGRLLAIADALESLALWEVEKRRPTNAARLMQKFADRPCSTWRTIELSLVPYKATLGEKGYKYNKELDDVMDLFIGDDFIKDLPLTGEFLLSYHTQRAALWEKTQNDSDDLIEENIEQVGEPHELNK